MLFNIYMELLNEVTHGTGGEGLLICRHYLILSFDFPFGSGKVLELLNQRLSVIMDWMEANKV